MGEPLISADDFEDVVFDSKIMTFDEFETFISECKETDFFIIMQTIFLTVQYLQTRGIETTTIFQWFEMVNPSLGGRTAVWEKAYRSIKADLAIQKALKEVGKDGVDINGAGGGA